jgi:hypothetical protein
MIRAAISAGIFAVTTPVMGLANGGSLPAMPEWQTDTNNCSWHWREGEGIGLWAETCRFNGATWQVVWDDNLAAFVTKNDDTVIGLAVQAFTLSSGAGIDALSEKLVDAGSLDASHACIWQTIALRPAPRTIAFHVLTPLDQAAFSPTASGDIPDTACGPYGASTHGVRYFMTDLRWPDFAIFIEEGQERPMFDPASITALP